jgi:hypothetical protein
MGVVSGRPRIFPTDADRQRAYRDRKALDTWPPIDPDWLLKNKPDKVLTDRERIDKLQVQITAIAKRWLRLCDAQNRKNHVADGSCAHARALRELDQALLCLIRLEVPTRNSHGQDRAP